VLEKMPLIKDRVVSIALGAVLTALFLLSFTPFMKVLAETWISDTEFSYGMLIPVIVVYLIWRRRDEFELKGAPRIPSFLSFVLVVAGCALQIVASLNGTLLISGAAFSVTLIGIFGFLCGRHCLKVLAMPLSFLVLMVPLPSYVLGTIGWNLQMKASSISSAILEFVGVPVYQEGVLLRLPNYALEVKQACSGLRSIFALLTLALVIGLVTEKKWRARILLIVITPILALGANIVRIVTTGFLAWHFGGLALDEWLHTILGIGVFLATVLALLGFQKILRWATNLYA
jgi:exosortase